MNPPINETKLNYDYEEGREILRITKEEEIPKKITKFDKKMKKLPGFVAYCIATFLYVKFNAIFAVLYLAFGTHYGSTTQRKEMKLLTAIDIFSWYIGTVLIVSLSYLVATLFSPKVTICVASILVQLFFGSFVISLIRKPLYLDICILIGILCFQATLLVWLRKDISMTGRLIRNGAKQLYKSKMLIALFAGALLLFLIQLSSIAFAAYYLPEGILCGRSTDILILVLDLVYAKLTLNFIRTLFHMSVCGTVATHLLLPIDETELIKPLSHTLYLIFRFMLGAVILGEFINIFSHVSHICKYLYKGHYKQTAVVGFKERIAQFCRMCKQVIDTFNYHAYTIMTLNGSSFCRAIKLSFQLFNEKGTSKLAEKDTSRYFIALEIVTSNSIAFFAMQRYLAFAKNISFSYAPYTVGIIVAGVYLSYFVLTTIFSLTSASIICYSIDDTCLDPETKFAIGRRLGSDK